MRFYEKKINAAEIKNVTAIYNQKYPYGYFRHFEKLLGVPEKCWVPQTVALNVCSGKTERARPKRQTFPSPTRSYKMSRLTSAGCSKVLFLRLQP